MKFFLIFLTFAFTQDLGCALPIGQQINITRNLCIQTTGVSPEKVHRIEHFDYSDNQDVYRYIRCIFENLDLWNEANGIEDQRVVEILEGQQDLNMILNAVKECNKDMKTENMDEWLYNTVGCIINGNIGESLENMLTAS